uniref:Uncharacterized protein n=1 Tax=Arion vulgaris TaxID=1028688 RepID=A0A0B7B9J4_9EUPU
MLSKLQCQSSKTESSTMAQLFVHFCFDIISSKAVIISAKARSLVRSSMQTHTLTHTQREREREQDYTIHSINLNYQ